MSSFAINGGKVDVEGHGKPYLHLFRPGVVRGLTVTQRAAGANMSVDVNLDSLGYGSALIPTSAGVNYFGWIDATANVPVTTSNPSNPRIDVLVAWIDLSLITSTVTNNVGALKFTAVAGTPAASPVVPNGTAIQTAIGAGNPYIVLAPSITVATSASTVVNSNITYSALPAALTMPWLYGGSNNTKGHLVPNVVDDTVALLGATQTLSSNTTVPSNGLSNPYKFSAYGGVASSLAAASWNRIIVNTKEYDSSNNFDAVTNSRFTAPVAGFYQFAGGYQVTSGGVGDSFDIALYKNGTLFKEGIKGFTGAAGTNNFTISPPPFQLALGDYVELWAYNGTGGGKTVTAGSNVTYFGGYLVSKT